MLSFSLTLTLSCTLTLILTLTLSLSLSFSLSSFLLCQHLFEVYGGCVVRYPNCGWREKYTRSDCGSYRSGLRSMLSYLLGFRSWLEFSIGSSWQQYRSIDACVSRWHFGMQLPPTEAWHLLHTSKPAQYRVHYQPEQRLCNGWMSIG